MAPPIGNSKRADPERSRLQQRAREAAECRDSDATLRNWVIENRLW